MTPERIAGVNTSGENLYFDSAGNKCNLRGMIRREPQWIFSRFTRMEKDIEAQAKEIERLRVIAKDTEMAHDEAHVFCERAEKAEAERDTSEKKVTWMEGQLKGEIAKAEAYKAERDALAEKVRGACQSIKRLLDAVCKKHGLSTRVHDGDLAHHISALGYLLIHAEVIDNEALSRTAPKEKEGEG